MTWQHKTFDAVRAIKSAQQSLTEALSHARKPYLLGAAQLELNRAIRKLAEAQWRLIQAESDYNIEKESNRK